MIIHSFLLVGLPGIGLTLARNWAYLDPGSGSFILQILIASLMGAMLFIGLRWRQFTTYLRNRFSKDKESDDDPGQPE